MLRQLLTPQRLTRLAVVTLWVAVSLGAVGGTYGALAAGRPPAAAAAANGAGGRCPDGWAELYVRTWLAAGEGSEEALRRFWPQAPDLRGLEPGVRYAAATAPVGCSEVRPGWWRVVVAAEVVERAGDDHRPAGTRFLSVPVRSDEAGLVALALPAEVARPATLAPPERPYAGSILGDPVLADRVAEILSAYLVGDVPLGPLTSPGSRLRPVVPSPYAGVEIRSLSAVPATSGGGPANSGDRHLLAGVRAIDRSGRPVLLDYALTLRRRGGRWEAASIGGMPAFRERRTP